MTDTGFLQLHILRHAHASSALQGQRDHQRSLDERGVRDAGVLASLLIERDLGIQQVVCSTATRARQTLDIVRPAIGDTTPVEASDGLYALGLEAYFSAVNQFRSSGSLLLVGHNPMVDEFVGSFCREGSEAALRQAHAGLGTAHWATIEVRMDRGVIGPGDGYLREIIHP